MHAGDREVERVVAHDGRLPVADLPPVGRAALRLRVHDRVRDVVAYVAVSPSGIEVSISCPRGVERIGRCRLVIAAAVPRIAPALERPSDEVLALRERNGPRVAPRAIACLVGRVRILPACPQIGAATIGAVAAGDWSRERFWGPTHAVRLAARSAAREGSGGLEVAAGAGKAVAGGLRCWAAVLIGIEGAIIEVLTHRTAFCRAVHHPDAVRVSRIVWEAVSGRKLVRDGSGGVVDVAPCRGCRIEGEARLQLHGRGRG